MKRMFTTIILLISCMLVACEFSGQKRIEMPDGSKLRMSTYQADLLEFSQNSEELILYPSTYMEINVPYTIIENDTIESSINTISFKESSNSGRYSAIECINGKAVFYYCAPFIFEEEKNREKEPKYWILVKITSDSEDEIKELLEIEDDLTENLIRINLDLYEEY